MQQVPHHPRGPLAGCHVTAHHGPSWCCLATACDFSACNATTVSGHAGRRTCDVRGGWAAEAARLPPPRGRFAAGMCPRQPPLQLRPPLSPLPVSSRAHGNFHATPHRVGDLPAQGSLLYTPPTTSFWVCGREKWTFYFLGEKSPLWAGQSTHIRLASLGLVTAHLPREPSTTEMIICQSHLTCTPCPAHLTPSAACAAWMKQQGLAPKTCPESRRPVPRALGSTSHRTRVQSAA